MGTMSLARGLEVRAARGLARTFQHPELFSGLTVRDNLVLAHRARHAKSRIWSDFFTMGSLRPSTTTEKEVVDQLVDLLGLDPIANLPALGLPLGMARLVELGRALASSPTVLLLDEPSSGLDSAESAQLESTLRRVATERAISVLLVEHDVELVMRLCAAIYVLDFGALIASGSPREIQANPAVQAAYLGQEVAGQEPSETDAAPRAEGLMDNETRQPMLSVRQPEQPDHLEQANGSVQALAVQDLSVRYGEASALNGVSFSIGSGTVLAVLGANGAGKSSLARAISGLVPPSGGKVVFAGQETTSWSPDRIRRAGMVHLPEGRGVFRSLSVMENLKMGVRTLERSARQSAIEMALELFPVLDIRRRQTAGLLSGGEQQMLSLARALVASPKVLIADEMSLGLAPRLVDMVFEGLSQAREAGVTVIMIEQYVHRALAFADECIVLQRGEVTWKGPAHVASGEVLRRYLGEAMTAGS